MKKHLRCPMGIPGGIFAAMVGLVGIVVGIISKNWMCVAMSAALFFIGGPLVRVTMMVHSANDRLDEIESSLKK